MPSPIVILGSINMDLVCRTPAMPAAGETILGGDFLTLPGGKGANQAVAAARLAGDRAAVHLIGRVGGDAFGQTLLRGLAEHGVETRHVRVTRSAASGVAMILVDRKGENSIVVAPGANATLLPADVEAAEALIASAAVVVMQLEVPLVTVRRAIALCRRHRVFTILDPAPVPPKPLGRAFLDVDVVTPNETEAAMLAAEPARAAEPKQVAAELLARGSRAVVLKRGSRGSVFVDKAGQFHTARPFKVKVVDTTAAGDAFTAALAVGRAEGMTPPEMLSFANAAGALCCTRFGAQPALPTRAAVEALLRRT